MLKKTFDFKYGVRAAYCYNDHTPYPVKRSMKKSCLEMIRKRFKWLSELSDDKLLEHLEIEDKRVF